MNITRGLFILFAVVFLASIAQAQSVSSPSKGLQGIEYAFDVDNVPNLDRQTVFVVFYGHGLKGWDAAGKAFPNEPRYVFSRIYRLNDLPHGYNWNSHSLAPHNMSGLFFDHLIKEYDFTRSNHKVNYLRGQSLKTLENNLKELLKDVGTDKTIIADTTFSFKYQDRNYVRPYSFEYKSPQSEEINQ